MGGPSRVLRCGSVWAVTVSGLLFLAAVVLYTAVNATWIEHGQDLGDFRSYADAARAVLAGQPLYEADHANLPMSGGTFKYPPFAAVLFVPLAYLSMTELRALALGVNLVALLALVWVCWGMLGHRRDFGRMAATLAVAAVCVGSQPVLWNMIWGQINLVLAALVLLDLARPDSARRKGIGVGIAAGIKLVPGLFVVYLVLTGRFRAATAAVGAFLTTVGLGFLVLPRESRAFWWGNFADGNRVSGPGTATLLENQSLRAVLARLEHAPDIATSQWLPVAAAIGVLGMVLAVLANRRDEQLLALSVVGLTSVLVSPLSWSHYWVWLVPFLVLGVHIGLLSGYRWRWLPLLAGYAVFFAWPLTQDQNMPFYGLIFVEADYPLPLLMVLHSIPVEVALLLFILAGVRVLRHRNRGVHGVAVHAQRSLGRSGGH
jgi:alpha-1,2-mannosyltransferase